MMKRSPCATPKTTSARRTVPISPIVAPNYDRETVTLDQPEADQHQAECWKVMAKRNRQS